MIMPIDNGYKYILVIKDCFTKYTWGIPLKNKKGETIANAFKQIIKESNRKPNKLWVDQGKEFYNQYMYKLFKFKNTDVMKKDEHGNYLNDIYSVFNENKANLAERQIRYIGEKLWFEFTKNNNQKWVHLLQPIINDYNNKIHATTKFTPNQLSDNPSLYRENFEPSNQKPKFQIGDKVRISKLKRQFAKSRTQNWTKEIFIIDKVLQTNPVTYHLKDLSNEPIHSVFYEEELQKTIIAL